MSALRGRFNDATNGPYGSGAAKPASDSSMNGPAHPSTSLSIPGSVAKFSPHNVSATNLTRLRVNFATEPICFPPPVSTIGFDN